MCYAALVQQNLDRLRHDYGVTPLTKQIDVYKDLEAENSKRFPPVADRVYPGSYAPVVFDRNGSWVTTYMRYGAHPPADIARPERYTTFNARRGNLSSPFWRHAFLCNHGFVVLRGFFEWVNVADLLRAGRVQRDQIDTFFQKKMQQRRERIAAQGKPYRPTATEASPLEKRSVVITFSPVDQGDLLVPVIISAKRLSNGHLDFGFALITDEPTPDVLRAGHDRCPVIMETADLAHWLRPGGKTAMEMNEVLGKTRSVALDHTLDESA